VNTDDHSAVLRQLLDLVPQGNASIVSTLCVETRSGQRLKIEAGTERMHAANFHALEDGGGIEADLQTRPAGTELEINPVLNPDVISTDISFSLKHETAPPTEQKLGGEKDVATRRLQFSAEEAHEVSMVSSTTLRLGTVRLLGLWKVEGAPDAKDKDLMQAAFLRIDGPIIDREWVEKRKKNW